MALESGRVNSYREAVVLLRFQGGAVIECVVDTGFDGALMLPRTFVSQIPISVIGELTFEMVGGARMSAAVGLTVVNWLEGLHQVEVIVSEGADALIGTELLIETILTIDYRSSRLGISTQNTGV